ncbi:MAG: response regulator [Alphaproteobacteria bacterium]|nr:response regulator [Alphaproteobacteria bacterium]
MEDVRDLEVLIGLNPSEAELMRAALIASGVRAIRTANTVSDYLSLCAHAEPDVGILGFTLGGQPTLDLLRAIRRGAHGANPFLPVIMAKANADLKVVQLALNAGAHEMIALPTTVRVVQALLHRAVFVGRPFVNVAGYVGPCRRRKPMTWLKDERRTVWAGYVHASHKTRYEFEDRV